MENSQATQNDGVQTENQRNEIEYRRINFIINLPKAAYYLLLVVKDFTKACLSFFLKHIILVVLLSTAIILPNFIEGPHSEILKQGNEIACFCLVWIIIGAALSIGIGRGFLIFALSIGTRIARITLRSYECNALPQFSPNVWAMNSFFSPCPTQPIRDVEFLDILLSVSLESVLWGFGTILRDLRPYFIAKPTVPNKKKIIELQDFEAHRNDQDFMDNTQRAIYNNLQKRGFITILLCGSIPNPFSDLDGTTCIYFGIPFITFFTATVIGKSIIKVHIYVNYFKALLHYLFVFALRYDFDKHNQR